MQLKSLWCSCQMPGRQSLILSQVYASPSGTSPVQNIWDWGTRQLKLPISLLLRLKVIFHFCQQILCYFLLTWIGQYQFIVDHITEYEYFIGNVRQYQHFWVNNDTNFYTLFHELKGITRDRSLTLLRLGFLENRVTW